MYQTLDLQFDSDKVKNFVLQNDRLLYNPFYVVAEQFCHDANLVIGGQLGMAMLRKDVTEQILIRVNTPWTIFVKDVDDVALLAHKMSTCRSPHIDARTVVFKEEIRKKEYSLSVNGRSFLSLHVVPEPIFVELGNQKSQCIFTDFPLRCLRPELQIIETYQKLYNPSLADGWNFELRHDEEFLFDMLQSWGTMPFGLDQTTKEGSSQKSKVSLNDILLKEFIANSKHILIGEDAIEILLHKSRSTNSRMEIISADEPKDIVKELKLSLVKTRYRDDDIFYKDLLTDTPIDFQLRKISFYVKGSHGTSPILDVYNSAKYELVSYSELRYAGLLLRIGSPHVLARFSLVTLWQLHIVIKSGNSALMPKSVDKFARFFEIRNYAKKLIMENSEYLYTMEYHGQHTNPRIAKKKLAGTTPLQTFYPQAMQDDGEEVDEPELNQTKDGGSTSDANCLLGTKSTIINLAQHEDLLQITKKVLGLTVVNLEQTLSTFTPKYTTQSDWGIGKNISSSLKKLSTFAKFIPPILNNVVDIGCGSGYDAEAVRQQFKMKSLPYCCDVDDNRATQLKKKSVFVQIFPNQEMPIVDGTVDLIMMNHVIHHINDVDDLTCRLSDIVRMLKVGGVLLLKDHDVISDHIANNVTFEHFAYSLAESETTFDKMANYNTFLPMTYRSAKCIDDVLSKNLSRLLFQITKGPTRVYYSVYQKNAST